MGRGECRGPFLLAKRRQRGSRLIQRFLAFPSSSMRGISTKLLRCPRLEPVSSA